MLNNILNFKSERIRKSMKLNLVLEHAYLLNYKILIKMKAMC